MSNETCPTCGNVLTKYGCKDVEQVGAFCRAPAKRPPCYSCGGDGLSRSTPHECRQCHGSGVQQ